MSPRPAARREQPRQRSRSRERRRGHPQIQLCPLPQPTTHLPRRVHGGRGRLLELGGAHCRTTQAVRTVVVAGEKEPRVVTDEKWAVGPAWGRLPA